METRVKGSIAENKIRLVLKTIGIQKGRKEAGKNETKSRYRSKARAGKEAKEENR